MPLGTRRVFRVPLVRCPVCHHALNAAGTQDDKPPIDGDFSVCLSCASVLRYADGQTRLEVVPKREIGWLSRREREGIAQAQAMVKHFQAHQAQSKPKH